MANGRELTMCVLIPAFEPGEALVRLVRDLRVRELPVLVVNDGSSPDKAPIFEVLGEFEGVYQIDHHVNRGKGAALKTGFGLLAQRGFTHVITADADGQHAPDDILAVARALAEHPSSLVLGIRDFENMPPRSKAGNKATRFLAKAACNVEVSDTQTGLRGLPLAHADELREIDADGFDFEMAVLARSSSLFEGIVEIPIETIYELPCEYHASVRPSADRRAIARPSLKRKSHMTHFKTLRDGFAVARVLLAVLPSFMLVSATSFILDYALFAVLSMSAGFTAVAATVVARVLSATYNYTFNRLVTFRVSGREYTPLRYLMLAGALLVVNSLVMWLFVDTLGLPGLLVKIPVEIALYLVSFLVQTHLAARDAPATLTAPSPVPAPRIRPLA